jgi:hypothetical protein
VVRPWRALTAWRGSSTFAVHAAAAAQARCTARISAGVGSTGEPGRNWTARMTRRSATSMSANQTACLVWYQGARAAGGDVGGGLAMQRLPADHQAHAHQTERDGPLHGLAGAVRACPTPATCRLSSNSTSIGQRSAQRSPSAAGLALRSVDTSARSYPSGAPAARTSTTCTGRGPNVPYHRQRQQAPPPACARRSRPRPPAASAGWSARRARSAPAGACPWCGVGRACRSERRQLVQCGVRARPGRDLNLLGEVPQGLAGVGGVTGQVDLAVGAALGDQGDQLDRQVKLGPVGLLGTPQAAHDRQAHRPLRHKR